MFLSTKEILLKINLSTRGTQQRTNRVRYIVYVYPPMINDPLYTNILYLQLITCGSQIIPTSNTCHAIVYIIYVIK